jgi:hypothetical protein
MEERSNASSSPVPGSAKGAESALWVSSCTESSLRIQSGTCGGNTAGGCPLAPSSADIRRIQSGSSSGAGGCSPAGVCALSSTLRSHSVSSSFSPGCGWAPVNCSSQEGVPASSADSFRAESSQCISETSACSDSGFAAAPVMFASQSGISSSSPSAWDRRPANRSSPEAAGLASCGCCMERSASSSALLRADSRASRSHCGRTGSSSAVFFFVGICPGLIESSEGGSRRAWQRWQNSWSAGLLWPHK